MHHRCWIKAAEDAILQIAPSSWYMWTLCEAVKIISLVQDQGKPGDSVTSPLRNGTALFFTLHKRGALSPPKGPAKRHCQINHILFGVNRKSCKSLLEAEWCECFFNLRCLWAIETDYSSRFFSLRWAVWYVFWLKHLRHIGTGQSQAAPNALCHEIAYPLFLHFNFLFR